MYRNVRCNVWNVKCNSNICDCNVWFKFEVPHPPVGTGWGHHHYFAAQPSGHHRVCPSRPWGASPNISIPTLGTSPNIFSTKVISPPRPHRGVAHLEFERHIITCVKHNMQLDQPKVMAQLWRLTLASTDHYSKVERLFSNFKGVPLTHWGLECRARLVLGQGLIAVTRSKWTNRSGNIEVFLI